MKFVLICLALRGLFPPEDVPIYLGTFDSKEACEAAVKTLQANEHHSRADSKTYNRYLCIPKTGVRL